MEIPITDLLSATESTQWILQHFHPQGLMCPKCGAPGANASVFRTTKKSQLSVYRCRTCHTVYNLSTNTIFQQCHLAPPQVVLFLRGVLKGEASITLAAELSVSPQTILNLRRDVQDSARFLQSKTPLTDDHTETDEMFQYAGEKSEKHADPMDPPRRRANKQCGRGTYDNDRPPIVGTIGRESGHVRLRVVPNTTGETLEAQVHQFTHAQAIVYTDESNGYNHIIRVHATVNHSVHEYARDDDGDGMREVHCNTAEGMWTDVRNFLRPAERRSQETPGWLRGDL